jgi:hypothetical protein
MTFVSITRQEFDMSSLKSVQDFKAKYVVDGQAVGFGSIKCRWTDDGIHLGDDLLPFDVIVDTTSRDKRIVILLDQNFVVTGKMAKRLMQGPAIALEPSGIDARQLEMAIDKQCSAREAAARRRQLESDGQAHLIREETCPVCESTIDLSGLDGTEYTYCRFCESLFTRHSCTDGTKYRTCDQCGMFDHIQPYTEAYFYFLLIVYGFSHKRVYLCHSCAHKLFLKMLGLNFIFILGVPSAVWVKIKSAVNRKNDFEGLDKANALSKSGKPQEAMHYYQTVLADNPNHPAVLMNKALGQLNGGDQSGAVSSLQESVRACNHYDPVVRLLRQ